MSTKPITLSSTLLDLTKGFDKHFWFGEAPPFAFASANPLHCTNFRLSPANHQRYDVVWYFEQMPSDLAPGKFELVFDELLRLIGDAGKLVVRYQQNDHFTVTNFKHFLGRRYNARISIDSESVEKGTYTTVFNVQRLNLARYRAKDWTFAIITSGKRRENVLKFMRSIRDSDADHAHEILVAGPRDAAYDEFSVRYHEAQYRDQLAEISKKKNDLALAASRSNLLIAHDRYSLDSNFFGGFEKFGYDFDFVTVLQWYECGVRFPAYVAMSQPSMTWSPPMDCEDYSTLRPMQFLNGGLLIAKTETLRDVRLNDMLFWNQAEDVELSHTFRNHGLPPRVNCFASATTLGITPEYTKAFISESPMKQQFRGRSVGMLQRSVLTPARQLERFLRPHFKKMFRKAG